MSNKQTKSIEERFYQEENPNRRVYIFECYIKHSNLEYLTLFAKRKGISRSKLLENIIEYLFTIIPIDKNMISYTEAGDRRVSANAKWGKKTYRKIPKFYIHPSYILILKYEKERRKVSYTVLLDELFLSYRKKFPIQFRKKN